MGSAKSKSRATWEIAFSLDQKMEKKLKTREKELKYEYRKDI